MKPVSTLVNAFTSALFVSPCSDTDGPGGRLSISLTAGHISPISTTAVDLATSTYTAAFLPAGAYTVSHL